MLSAASATYLLGGPSFLPLVDNYVLASCAACLTAALTFVFIDVAKMALVRADYPLRKAWGNLKPRLPMLAVPALIMPLFLSGYTAAKSAIFPLAGFRFDLLFAEMDSAIFRTDPWRLTHALLGPLATEAIAFLYATAWFTLLAYTKAFVALYASPRVATRYFTAALLTWFIGGFALAYSFSAAGPIFTEYNGLEHRFAELKLALLQTAGPDSHFVIGPAYLDDSMTSGAAYQGAGISAMPSMHIAACTLYCLLAKGTRWFFPALAYLLVIIIGSVHSGFHYAVDAPVAVIVAILCWKAAAPIASLANEGREIRDEFAQGNAATAVVAPAEFHRESPKFGS
ncbi:phosphatase PAP2 family protein [Sphingomonas xanthus]|nr:phosphatase PAP2 family protein [Sphingomonas xanthus]